MGGVEEMQRQGGEDNPRLRAADLLATLALQGTHGPPTGVLHGQAVFLHAQQFPYKLLRRTKLPRLGLSVASLAAPVLGQSVAQGYLDV